MEIRKNEGKNSLWDDTKQYAIEEIVYKVSNGKPTDNKKLTLIDIDSADDFLKLSIEIGKQNEESLEMTKKLGFPFYTEKKIVTL